MLGRVAQEGARRSPDSLSDASSESSAILLRPSRSTLVPCLLAALLAASCGPAPPDTEWGRAQRLYADAGGSLEPGPRSLTTAGGRTESCVSCHLGLDPALPAIDSEPLFAAHPAVGHEPGEAGQPGCTDCHGGEPAGLTAADAHGERPSSMSPLLPSAWLGASCAACHQELVAPPDAARTDSPAAARVREQVERLSPAVLEGKAAFHERGCLGCHRVGSLGGGLALELTSVGEPAAALLGFGEDFRAGMAWNKLLWHYEHPLTVSPLRALEPVSAEQAARFEPLHAYLLSLRGREPAVEPQGRPFPADGEGLHRALCSACHGADGEGAQWSGRSRWAPGLATRGHATIAGARYLRETIARGRPLRGMPGWLEAHGGLRADEIERLAAWYESRRAGAPPADAIASGGSAERGRQVHAERCGGCHADDAHGGSSQAPALSLEQWAQVVAQGRPEAGMPPFAAMPETEWRDLAALRRSGGLADAPARDLRAAGSAADAEADFARSCARCHGPGGAGAGAPSLRSAAWQEVVTDEQVVMAILAGRPGARTPSWAHASDDEPMSAARAWRLASWIRSRRHAAFGSTGEGS